jgi:hypothetical protein
VNLGFLTGILLERGGISVAFCEGKRKVKIKVSNFHAPSVLLPSPHKYSEIKHYEQTTVVVNIYKDMDGLYSGG